MPQSIENTGFFRGTPERIRTAGLQSRSLKNAVFYRLIKWLKVLKIKDFLILPFDNVGRNNSTFHIGVELLLNFSGIQSRHKKSPRSASRGAVFRRSCVNGVYRENSVSASIGSFKKFAVKIGTNFLFQILWQLGNRNTRSHRRSDWNLSFKFRDSSQKFSPFTPRQNITSFLWFFVA